MNTLLVGCEENSGRKRRFRLLSCTTLASGLMLGAIAAATPGLAGNVTGANGNAGADDVETVINPPAILTEPATLTIGPVHGTGGAGDPGGNATGTAGANGAAGANGPNPGDAGGVGGTGEGASGTGGNGGKGGIGTGRGIGPVTVDINGNIVNGVDLDLTGGNAVGGDGGRGGNGTGATAGNGGGGGAGGSFATGASGNVGGAGGMGGTGGNAVGQGGVGGKGGDGQGGSIADIRVEADGAISNGVSIVAASGFGVGGDGGAGGTAQGGTGGDAGQGGHGGNIGTITSGNDNRGGPGGKGGDAGHAGAFGGPAGDGGAGSGGDVGTIILLSGGAINGGIVIRSTANGGGGGDGGHGGNGTGGVAGDGGTGGAGGTIADITTAGNGNRGGTGGAGTGFPGSAAAVGGSGGNGGMGVGGSTGIIVVDAGGNVSGLIDIASKGGLALGGRGGDGGLSVNGTFGANGAGGAGGTVGNIAEGDNNAGAAGLGNKGGAGGGGLVSGSAGGKGGNGGDATGGSAGGIVINVAGHVADGLAITSGGGDALAGRGGLGANGSSSGAGGDGGDGKGGDTRAIDIDIAGGVANGMTITSRAGNAVGGLGGNAGARSGGGAADGGKGGDGGGVASAGSMGNPANNNLGGEGGAGGDGNSAQSVGGLGGTGGDGIGGHAGKIIIGLAGNSTGPVTVTAVGGSGFGSRGGDGGTATAPQAGKGGAGGEGGDVGTVTGGGIGNLAGKGGTGGAGGDEAEARGGHGNNGGEGKGGNADVSITQSGILTSAGVGIDVQAIGGSAVGGDGGDGGSATGGQGGTGGEGGAGGSGGNGDGKGGDGGAGGKGGMAFSGNGGNGGAATAGSATVALSNSGDITTTGAASSAIRIVARGGDAVAGDGGAAGTATSGGGGAGGKGGNGGPTSGDGGNGGQGGDSGNATGGNGGRGASATGGSAQVAVTNNGRILGTGASSDGIVIETSAGSATRGLGGAAGVGLIPGPGAGGGAGGGGGVAGSPGSGGVMGVVDGGDLGFDGARTNGASSITVDNTNLIDVTGIGVTATTGGDNGSIRINNTGGTIIGDQGGLVLRTDLAFNANSDIDVVNSGLIASGNLLTAAAINAKGASAEIDNAGTVLGFMDLTEQGDTVVNQAGGAFAARGTSEFRGGLDLFTNNGIVASADDSAVNEHVRLQDLELFSNSGLIAMVDGAAGDTLTMTGNTAYTGTGAGLAVDAFLGEGMSGKSDMLIIDGATASTAGVTAVSVNVTGVSGANTDGITVVAITGGGVTHDGDFVLAGGPLNVGFFTWDLRREDNVHELFTSGVGAGAYEFAAGLTATQDIWYQTTGTLLQRQADLRPLLGATQVTPVADYSEPVAPTPAGSVGPGFWLKGVGAYLERDQGDGLTVTDRKQTIYGGLAGFDFATEGHGDTWLFGLFGGYTGSKLKFNETDTEWSFDGPSVGAYATYLNEALYVDMLIKADFLSIDIEPGSVGPGADDESTDGVNIGGLIDAGYKIGSGEGVFVEPQAALAVVHTSIDDVDIFGGTVDFDDETSVRGRLGVRLGYDHTAANQVVYSSDVTASVWQEFNGSNDVTIDAPDFPVFGVSDEPGETVGDISLGFSVAAPEGWSGFLRGNYQFSDDLEAIAGNLGFRYSW